MKKRNVVLCELCAEDRLAATVVHYGLCTEHDAAVGALFQSPNANKQVRVVPSRRSAAAKQAKVRKAFKRKIHKRCGQAIDPRGWSKHVKACKGKGKVRG